MERGIASVRAMVDAGTGGSKLGADGPGSIAAAAAAAAAAVALALPAVPNLAPALDAIPPVHAQFPWRGALYPVM